jgi:hypothetical protein
MGRRALRGPASGPRSRSPSCNRPSRPGRDPRDASEPGHCRACWAPGTAAGSAWPCRPHHPSGFSGRRIPAIRAALGALLASHQALRLRFTCTTGTWSATVIDPVDATPVVEVHPPEADLVAVGTAATPRSTPPMAQFQPGPLLDHLTAQAERHGLGVQPHPGLPVADGEIAGPGLARD